MPVTAVQHLCFTAARLDDVALSTGIRRTFDVMQKSIQRTGNGFGELAMFSQRSERNAFELS
jgi:hypothetical protein